MAKKIMAAFSTLATIISALSFSLGIIALLYPDIVSHKKRWRVAILCFGVSLIAFLIAIFSFPQSENARDSWTLLDWAILGFSGALIMAFLTREIWLPKKHEANIQKFRYQETGQNEKKIRRKNKRKG